MKRIRWGVVPVMLVLAGCATMDIHSDFDCKADFSKLKTFSWVVEKVLATKGYQKSDVGQSDFLVAYQAAIEKKIDTRMTRFPYETPSTRDIASGNFAQDLTWAYGGSQTFLSQYEEGTLILDIVDPQKKKLMWRGTAKATLSEGRDSAKKEARLNEGVQKIFETFPPK